MKPTEQEWYNRTHEHLKHLPEDFGNHCNDHDRIIAIQDLLVQKGILKHDLIMEKEWANAGFKTPRYYRDYEDQEIMKLCRFSKD